MMDHGFRTTVEIAIGDNLLVKPWIERLVKVNKSFLVQRSLGMREMLLSSKRMSRYMHFAIEEKKENIWIAQREGRAKDSNDRTQESVLKMMAMGGEGAPIESLKSLHIVPLAISYEYDPCDYLKAKEFQQKRDDAAFKKSPEDDLKNMQTGIFGYKGRVVYRTGTPVNEWIDTLADCPKGEVFRAVADRIDKEIHSRYEIFPVNRIALDLLNGNNQEADGYTEEEKEKFTAYIESRIAMVDLPERDEAFLRERLLTMVANPLINYYQSQD